MRTISAFVFSAALAVSPLLAQEPVTPTPSAPAPSESAAETPKTDRVTFAVKLTGMPGGGRAEGSAGTFEYQEGQYLVAAGGVEVKYQDLKLKAERVRIDIPTNRMTAEGEVVLDEGPRRLAGTTLEYDLETRTGRVTDATAFVSDPGFVFSGDEIAKVGEQTYTVVDGVFTSCVDQKVPDWSLRMSSAEVTLEGYAKVKNARMRFKNVPMFYFPYILWPAKTERSSGLLVPKPGYSSRRGVYLGLAYFQTLGRSADTTFFADLFSEEYFGVGNEIRYRPSERTKGNFRAHLITEPDEITDEDFQKDQLDNSWMQGDNRWKVQLNHETNQLWGKFRGVIAYEDYSDFDYLQDYERSVNLQTKSVVRSQGYLSANFGVSSLNILAEQNQRISRGFVTTLRQLPEVEYRVRNAKLGNTPLYLSFLGSVNYFDIDRSEEPRGFQIDYARADVFPTLSIPLSSLSWLSTKLDLSYRATWYNESGVERPDLVASDDPLAFLEGGSLTRTYPQASLEVIGPSFSRIFDKPVGPFAKLKHVIEPRINYVYVADIDDTLTTQEDPLERTSRIIQFDEVDRVLPANLAIFSITNRLLAKPKPKKKEDPAAEAAKEDVTKTAAEIDEEATEQPPTPTTEDGTATAATPATTEPVEEEEGSAFEIASFELAQAYSLDDEQPQQQSSSDLTLKTREGPIVAALRLNPSQWTTLKADLVYNTLFDAVQSYAVSGGTRFGHHALGLTWRTSRRLDFDLDETTSEQAQLSTTIGLWREALKLNSYLSYDLQRSELLQQRHILTWQGKCLSFDLEYRESQFFSGRTTNGEPIVDRDYRFSLTLRNVGTFLDFSGSVDSSF